MIDPSLPAGLVAVVGDEGTGKTRLLRELTGQLHETPSPGLDHDAIWLDLSLPKLDDSTPQDVWDTLRTRCPRWNAALLQELALALGLQPHVGKTLSMLSTGTRRKVALAGLLATEATVTCLDQPYAALDMASIRVIREFLHAMANHPTRTWVVADYEADLNLPWRRIIRLG
ncbi:ATP-binding cassette domain-containing protein [Azohydromonas australica]|uniref:ATP-binding cassette domain-containing protein n=1 Tax=Azohydromonas australica TaxID=364039 RepID=UPI0004183A93|nr:ABC transporter ATP-binding protein [Azohydromonas australica]